MIINGQYGVAKGSHDQNNWYFAWNSNRLFAETPCVTAALNSPTNKTLNPQIN
jgi:hypothetical protein